MSSELPSLPDDTRLWRYMKLSSFLALLQGKAFLPTVRELQKSDRREGEMHPDHRFLSADLSSAEKSMLHSTAADHLKAYWDANKNDPHAVWQCISRAYAEAINPRIAVWCWHRSTNESYPMWQVYGHQGYGVAVVTTVAQLQQSVRLDRVRIAEVKYIERNNSGVGSLQPNAEDQKMYLRRHFLLKGIEYKAEQEVRMFAVTPPGGPAEGIHIRVDPVELINSIVISPYIPASEAEAMIAFLKGQPVLRGKEMSQSGIRKSSDFLECNMDASVSETGWIHKGDLGDPIEKLLRSL